MTVDWDPLESIIGAGGSRVSEVGVSIKPYSLSHIHKPFEPLFLFRTVQAHLR